MIDVTTLTDNELISLMEIIAAEQTARAENHRSELIQDLCDAFNKVKKELPNLKLDIETYDDSGRYEIINIFDYFGSGLTINDFN